MNLAYVAIGYLFVLIVLNFTSIRMRKRFYGLDKGDIESLDYLMYTGNVLFASLIVQSIQMVVS